MKRKLLSIVFLLAITVAANAQTHPTLLINGKDGTRTEFPTNTIRKLTFVSGKIQINTKDGITTNYELNSINYLHFKKEIAFSYQEQTLGVHFFPNPVINELYINYESRASEFLQIEIVDLQGKVLDQQTKNIQEGKNQILINVAQLPQGFYTVRVQSGTMIKTNCFIKN